jgi:Fe-S cluster assembly protein SufD
VSPFDSWMAETDRAGAGLDWLATRREAARQRVRDGGLPSSKQEAWRYTSLTRLMEQGFAPAALGERTDMAADAAASLAIDGLDSRRAVVVNGAFAPELSALGPLPQGVRIGSLKQILANDPDALRDRLDAMASGAPPLFAALNMAGLDDGLVVLIDAGVRLERPLELIHLSVGGDTARLAQPRHLVSLGAGAEASLIERYASPEESLYCTNSVLEIALASQARLAHQRIQIESPAAFHIAGLFVQLDAASSYRCINFGLGGSWARTELRVRFVGEGAECDLQGLYLAGDRQLMDFHLDVDHRVPGCTSRETFKGILYGKGRAVFDGRVVVQRQAQRTDAAMSSKNLLLSEGAEVDVKPQLEIDADDVKCSHGTTVGQIEPEMLFYLRSRGIPLAHARRMLCLGFAAEILDALTPEALRDHVAREVGTRLDQAPLG